MRLSGLLNRLRQTGSGTNNENNNKNNIENITQISDDKKKDLEIQMPEEENIIKPQPEVSKVNITQTHVISSKLKRKRNKSEISSEEQNMTKKQFTTRENLIDQETMEVVSPQVYSPIKFEIVEKGLLTYSIEEFKYSFKHSLKNNFLKSATWSPDTSCILTTSEDCSLRLFEFNSEKLMTSQTELTSVLQVKEGETIYDSCWYPFMNSYDHSTCFFLSTSASNPIHMWDAFSGKLKASYRAFDQADELTAAFSVRFNRAGDTIYAGYNNMIRVFDINSPGRPSSEFATRHKKGKGWSMPKLSLKGIISCLEVNPQNPNLIACGSYSRSIGIFQTETFEPIQILQGHQGGVTQVKFSEDGNYLFSGGRKDSYIYCWDMRKLEGAVYKLPRVCRNNQRLMFDINPVCNYLFTSSQDGNVLVYDLNTFQHIDSIKISLDVVNGVSCIPLIKNSETLLAISTGERKFILNDEEDKKQKEKNNTQNGLFIYGYV